MQRSQIQTDQEKVSSAMPVDDFYAIYLQFNQKEEIINNFFFDSFQIILNQTLENAEESIKEEESVRQQMKSLCQLTAYIESKNQKFLAFIFSQENQPKEQENERKGQDQSQEREF